MDETDRIVYLALVVVLLGYMCVVNRRKGETTWQWFMGNFAHFSSNGLWGGIALATALCVVVEWYSEGWRWHWLFVLLLAVGFGWLEWRIRRRPTQKTNP